MVNGRPTRPRILIVSDNSGEIATLAAALPAEWDIRSALPDEAWIEAARNLASDLILLLETQSGHHRVESCQRLRGTDGLQDVPVVFVSTRQDVGHKLDAFSAGGNDYIVAPYESKELNARISTHIALYTLRKELASELAERRKAERQLEQLLSLLGTAMESTADGILVFDAQGKIVRFNQRFSSMWEMSDDMLAFWDHASIFSRLLEQITTPREFSGRLEALHDSRDAEYRGIIRTEDGRIMEVFSPPPDPGETQVGRVLSFRDITAHEREELELRRERDVQKALVRQLEETHNQLLQSEKMASIGQLAAGVAHEINNPLGFISSNLGTLKVYVETLLRLLASYSDIELSRDPALLQRIENEKKAADLDFLQDDVHNLIDESIDGANRVRTIVQDLRNFSHPGEGKWELADLRAALESTINVVWNEIKYKAEIVRDLGDLPPVECRVSQLNQVFLNLLINATQAIADHGRITVKTRCKDGWASIAIEDTGCGIPPDIVDKIFDPFFTTKAVGKGTGLGLSLSYGIVKEHGGSIEVASEPGRGSAFTVRIPIRHVAPQEAGTADVG